ncbi:MAG: SMC-Scp complex subunit ScpB [Nitrospinota bacterium]|nr:MAG: SMC-Scp complex subunit ScpB [Nitrospinota bacterium]
MSLKAEIEAVLFALDTPISLEELAEFLAQPVAAVTVALQELVDEYRQREGGIAIEKQAEGYIFRIRSPYVPLVEQLLPAELDVGTLRTLSVIAWKQPLEQSALIRMRGNRAYTHIQTLLKRGLIERTPQGRTFLLKTTPRFAEEFRLSDPPQGIAQALQRETDDL